MSAVDWTYFERAARRVIRTGVADLMPRHSDNAREDFMDEQSENLAMELAELAEQYVTDLREHIKSTEREAA